MLVASLKIALARLLMRPGKWDELQYWQKEGDDEPAPPNTREEWYATKALDEPLCDIYDGWMWRSVQTDTTREWDERNRNVKDINVKNLHQRFVSLKCGIVVHINIDWFRALKRANYFTGTLWLTIDNLPRSIRFLRENTFLLLIIPGPTEPNTDQLNGLLEPFIRELEDLGEGEFLQIFDTFAHRRLGRYPTLLTNWKVWPVAQGCLTVRRW
ncbi:hypothetical protein BDR04DRAFT_1164826 [Suillus decipiens]|nr:hypothetical protein BDR04DRAFT_1164826 [Suillus decipiens]